MNESLNRNKYNSSLTKKMSFRNSYKATNRLDKTLLIFQTVEQTKNCANWLGYIHVSLLFINTPLFSQYGCGEYWFYYIRNHLL